MKIHPYLSLGSALIAMLMMTGCGQSDKNTEPASAVSTPGNAAAAGKPATGRAIAITANDTMKFNVTEIHAKPGEALAVTLVNEGTLPKFSMGHNWVLITTDVNLEAFASDAASAPTTEYVPESFKTSVLAATKLLGPKESDTVIFNAPQKPGRYPFVCSFPGHFQVGMKGVLIVE